MTTKEESLTESEFLDQEQERARLGLVRTLEDLKRSLKATADPKGWIRDYPLTSVAAGLAAGLLAGIAAPIKGGASSAEEPIVVEGRFRGLGRRPRRRHRSLVSVLSVGARWALRSLLRGVIPV